MLTQEDLTERYVFGGYIKRGDDTVLDIAVEAIDTPESISKAMNTVHRAMTNYAPKPIVISADKAQSDHAPAQTAALIAEQAVAASEPATAAIPATLERKPTPAPVPPPKPDRPLEGVRGMIHLRCEGCGKTLATSLKMKQQDHRPDQAAGPIPLYLPLLRNGAVGPDQSGGLEYLHKV